RKAVDAKYLETSVPATHRPTFDVAEDVDLNPIGDLVNLVEAPAGYTVLGAGKTAMDACNWLLDNGVDPNKIRWIKPRDSWLLDRASVQPLDLIGGTWEVISLGIEAMAKAEDLEDLLRRLEACGQIVRLDTTVEPTMFRGAILSQPERESLQQIEKVVRLGRVKHLARDRIALEGGEVTSEPGELYVDCTAYGLVSAPARPVFEPGRITLQSSGQTGPHAAFVAFLEVSREDDSEKNRLCRPVPTPSQAIDIIRVFAGLFAAVAARSALPDLAAWVRRSRLTLTRGLAEHMGDAPVQVAMGRFNENMQPAMKNAKALLVPAE
ncbi:MAG: NAD(P)-binding protein, partial [Acidimicrobiia bacterium]